MPATIAIDANVIVRYLTGDDKVQAQTAADLFRSAQAGDFKLLITASVLMETVYVLETVYGLEATVIAPKLISLLGIDNVRPAEGSWMIEAVQFYRTKNSHFGDAMLCAFAQAHKCEVATFDKGIPKKFTEIPIGTPGDILAGRGKSARKPHTN